MLETDKTGMAICLKDIRMDSTIMKISSHTLKKERMVQLPKNLHNKATSNRTNSVMTDRSD